MKKGTSITIIIVLVLLEIGTVIRCSQIREDSDLLKAKIEKQQDELDKKGKELEQYRIRVSNRPEDIVQSAKDAYYAKDGDELAKAYRRYMNLSIINEKERELIADFAKTLNRRIDNKALKEVVSEIAEYDSKQAKWKASKEYKEQQADIQRLLSQASQVAQQDSELKRKYGEAEVEYARQGKVKIGWTKELCELAWGKPDKKSSQVSSNGTMEFWHYNRKTSDNTLLFIDGLLESVSKSDK